MTAPVNTREARRLTDEALDALRQLAQESISKGNALDPGQLLQDVKRSVSQWDEPAGFSFAPFSLQADRFKPEKDDAQNVRALYGSLQNISLESASDENFWVWLSVNDHADYLKKRWLANPSHRSQETKGIYRLIFNRTDLNRSLVRHGLSRLWWYGKATHDPGRSNPYEFTEFMLKSQDIAASIMERNFSFNPEIAKGILEALLKDGGGHGSKASFRERYRNAAKHLTRVGAVRVLDALDRREVCQIVSDYLKGP